LSDTNKKEFLNQLKEIYNHLGTRGVKDHLEANDIDPEVLNGMQFSPVLRDVSKVQWKPKTEFIKLYHVEMNKKVTKGTLNDIELLGLTTRLSLFVDYEDNYLINKDGTYLTHKDIMNITGWGKKKVTQALKQLIENDIIFEEKQEEDKRKNKYYMNPNLFYKGSTIYKEKKLQHDNK
jgi:hypothetical protein